MKQQLAHHTVTGCNINPGDLMGSGTISGDVSYDMSCVMRKPALCICKNKGADQLRGNREADQRLCFCFLDSTTPLLP